ncbi:hypothetical protein H7J07_01615 [Mycobacterium koreense]|uniref:Protease n=1 Tax=Mycolicibacillus koreensis TaxID=1069220 RepID=A0AA91PH73_9MYCO|nr:hypothetical protein [Mycolicibacillus koreensis]MCV7246956.1 hypothetical protein [Mycolicibacillus koreensis]ODR11484.1 hypothetical protein BHQ15_02565 [Mycolicibacillus koreensis]OSC34994.1 hypothetical protein B8W67_04130 [Mycolicibacillus koreensis]
MLLRIGVVAVLLAGVGLGGAAGPAGAEPVLVYPGMEIHQDNTVCTLGFVDTAARVGFTAGHCRGSGPVTDIGNHVIGTLAAFRDNTPDGTTVNTDQVIADYEVILLAPDVAVNDILPGGRVLRSDPDLAVQPGDGVCHFGVITGESCGEVQAVNNGWFTMTNGVVSAKGDSGGPVYVLAPDGSGRIVGLFNSTWGSYPAAVSWSAAHAQIREDTGGG